MLVSPPVSGRVVLGLTFGVEAFGTVPTSDATADVVVGPGTMTAGPQIPVQVVVTGTEGRGIVVTTGG